MKNLAFSQIIIQMVEGNIDSLEEIGEEILNQVDYVLNEFIFLITKIIDLILKGIIAISRPLYIFLFVLGVVLYFARINRRLGRELIYGSIVLAFLIEVLLQYFI